MLNADHVINKIETETYRGVPECIYLCENSCMILSLTPDDFLEIQRKLREGQTRFYQDFGDEDFIDSMKDDLSVFVNWELFEVWIEVLLINSGMLRIEFELSAEGYRENEWGEECGSCTDGYRVTLDVPYELFMNYQL